MNFRIKYLTLLLSCFAFASITFSQQDPVYVITELQEEYNDLTPYLRIYQGEGKGIDSSMLFSQAFAQHLKPFDQHLLAQSQAVYWGKIIFKNESGKDLNDFVFYTGEGSCIDVFVFDENNRQLVHEKTGQLTPARDKRLQHSNRAERVLLSLPKNGLRKVFIRIEALNKQNPDFNIKLLKKDRYIEWALKTGTLLDGFFIGFMATMIALNLILFFTSRDKTFFYHFLFLLSVTIYMMEPKGILSDLWLLRDYPAVQVIIAYSALALLNFAYIQFVRSFTDIRSLLPKWEVFLKWLLKINIGVWLFVILYYSFTLFERFSDLVLISFIVFQNLSLLVLLFMLYRKGDKKSYFLFAAALLVIVGVIINGVSIAFSLGIKGGLAQLILAANVILFSFGLAYRMKMLLEEEQEILRLKDINEIKSRLYANITHEFRTPLTVIKGMVDEVQAFTPVQANSKMNKAVRIIRNNGNQLLSLVNRLLSLAKLESGRMTLDMKQGDVIAHLRYIIHSFDYFAKSRKIHLQFISDLPSFTMDFDADKIQQIVSNLLSNAIKFTPENGKIYLLVKVENVDGHERLLCQVKDTGKGIAPADLPKIFSRFYQGEGGKEQNEGTGIGLALTEELIKLMGGKIRVESEPEKGTTFHFELPVTKEATETQAATGVKINREEWMPATALETDEPDTERILRNSQHLPHLLIIEDNADVVYYLQTLLENDYDVSLAFDGEEGIEHAIETIPDVIISDVMMPKKDGFEVLTTLKSDQRTSHIPIVILTAKAGTDNRIDGLERGADAYLTKPFHKDELFAILKNVIRQSRLLQERYAHVLPDKVKEEEAASVKAEDAFLIQIKELLEAHLEDDQFGIPQICRALGMSRTQLHRKLTALTGKSTSLFIRYVRLHRAKELLKSPDMNISEVAYAVGYTDPSYFTKNFTEEFGVPPSQFQA